MGDQDHNEIYQRLRGLELEHTETKGKLRAQGISVERIQKDIYGNGGSSGMKVDLDRVVSSMKGIRWLLSTVAVALIINVVLIVSGLAKAAGAPF